MTHTQSQPQIKSAFDRELERAVEATIRHGATDRPTTAPPTPAPRPVGPAAPAGVAMWGPSSPRVTSPMAILIEVAGNSHKLQQQVASLVESLTGSPPPIRTREVHKLPSALLPAISALAHEIGTLQSEIATTLRQLKEELS